MDYNLPADLWDKVIPIAAAVGAVAGLIWDVGNSLRRSSAEPATGMDNIITFPRGWKDDEGARNLNLGFIGPMAVGAMAGVLLVLLAGRSSPGAQEAATAISQVSQNVANETATQARGIAQKNLTTQVTAYSLFLFAALGGLAGWPLLQALTTRTAKLIEAAVGVAYGPVSREASEAVAEQAKDLNLTPAQKRKLSSAAADAVKKSAPAALRVKK
jgi:hypothetical protein